MSLSFVQNGFPIRAVVILALVLSIAMPLWSGSASAQSPLPEIAAATPASAVVFHWTDLDRKGTQWQQAEDLLARVGLANALDLWEEAVLADGERSGGITQADLDALLGGEMAIVVMPAAVEHLAAMAMAGVASDTLFRTDDATPMAGGEAQPHGVVAILRPSDIDAAWAYAERQIADAAAEMGVEVEERTIDGAEALVLPEGAHDADQNGESTGMDHGMGDHGTYGHGGFAAARAGDVIVVGKTAEDLTDVIAVVEGNGESLVESAKAQAVAAELPADVLSFTYVDGQGILDALDPEMIAMLQTVMMEMPVELLASQTGLAITADDPGFRFDTVTILNDAVDLGAYTVENDPAVAAAAERAPAGTFAFLAGRLAPNTFDGSAYATAQAVNAAASGQSMPEDESGMMFPTEEQMAQEIAAASATLGFDLQTELFDLLGEEYIAFTTFPSISMDDFGVDAAAALTATDPATLAQTMAKIAAWIDRSPESGVDISARQVAGSPVYVATSEEMAGTPGLEFGVVEDQAVLGLGGGIDALTAQPAASLADDAQFQEVMTLLPNTYYQLGYIDIGQAIDPVMNLVGLFESFSEGGAPAGAATAAAEDDLRNLRALGFVAFHEGNVSGSSAIVYIDG